MSKQFQIRHHNNWGVDHYCIDDHVNLDELHFPREVIDLHDREIAEGLCEFLNRRHASDIVTIELFFRFLYEESEHYQFYYRSATHLMNHFINS